MSNFFLILIAFIVGLQVWRIIRSYRRIPDLPGFSEEEKAILSRQSLALILLLPFLPLAAYVVVFRGSRWLLITYLTVSTLIMTYIAISSIINRVSILSRRGGPPLKGQIAVANGILSLVIDVIIWTVVLFTNFLQLLGFQ